MVFDCDSLFLYMSIIYMILTYLLYYIDILYILQLTQIIKLSHIIFSFAGTTVKQKVNYI